MLPESKPVSNCRRAMMARLSFDLGGGHAIPLSSE
jgi:hypothetical protein